MSIAFQNLNHVHYVILMKQFSIKRTHNVKRGLALFQKITAQYKSSNRRGLDAIILICCANSGKYKICFPPNMSSHQSEVSGEKLVESEFGKYLFYVQMFQYNYIFVTQTVPMFVYINMTIMVTGFFSQYRHRARG
jgi:hypothetical protein